MRIYLDNCCLNRPFDNQSNLRVRLESEAIKTILFLCETKSWDLISSEVVEFEIANTPDGLRRKQLELIIGIANLKIMIDEQIVLRAKQFESLGMKAFDSMHLACAENNADIFLTVDDKFLKKAEIIKNVKIDVKNPLKWIEEVLK